MATARGVQGERQSGRRWPCGPTASVPQRAAVVVLGRAAAVVVLGRAAAGAGVEAANADTAAISATDMLVTIGFISSAHGPRRAPVFMSNS
jgi:hypothetical protein